LLENSRMTLLSGDQSADDNADGEGDADGLIRIISNYLVGHFKPFLGFALQIATGKPSSFERFAQATSKRFGFFAGGISNGCEQLLRVTHHGFQIGNQGFRIDSIIHNDSFF
jgi:hypothetical protein